MSTLTRLLTVGLAAAAVGCGSENDTSVSSDAVATEGTQTDTTPPVDNESSPPTTEALRLPLANTTDLVILGGTRDALEAVVAPMGGEIVLDEEPVVFQVRFPVESLDELREIETELREFGFDVQLNYADDEPAPDGDS